MSKIILKRVVSGFMILLMVVGIFIAVSNFTANNALALKKGDDFDAILYCSDWQTYSGCDCFTIVSWNCIIVNGN